MIARKIALVTYRTLHWGDRRLPIGLRSVLGLLIMVGGVFGWLPVLGFWMLALGGALVALDLPWTRKGIRDWMASLKARAEQ